MFISILQSYLRFWSKKYLARKKPFIVAITGSVGKTSTKEAIYEVLREKFNSKVRKSAGNLNTETGVPLAILGFNKSPKTIIDWLEVLFFAPLKSLSQAKVQVLVLEMAADKPGDISYLARIAKPNVAVLTAIGPSHLVNFGTMDKIIHEKTSLLEFIDKDGWAVLNVDNEHIREAARLGSWQKITYGIEQTANLTASDIQTKIKANLKSQTNFKLSGFGDIQEITLNTLGLKANIQAALAAIAVGKIFDISIEDIKRGLLNTKPENHRMTVVEGKSETIILDDSYNANPLSMKAALEVLKSLEAKRKIVVLGDMKEIGHITKEAHLEIAGIAKKVTSEVYSVGDLAKFYEADKHFENVKEAGVFLLKHMTKGDIILIKASRSIGLDKLVEILKK